MSIQRADMEAGKIDFADVSSARCLPPIHPGEILQEDFIAPLGLSVYALAGALNVPRSRLSDIVRGRRAITTDTALRLARYFGTSPEFWLNLQASHDLDLANRTLRPIIEREVTPRAA